jgi:hypothetical protein
MEILPYKLLVADTENTALLLINGADGEILREWPLPPEFTPIDVCLASGADCAYIPAVNAQDRGALFILRLDEDLSQLPLNLPAIERFAVGPLSHQAVLATRDGSLFLLDISQRSLSLFGRCGAPTSCVGLATDQDLVYTVWQQDGNGVLATLSSAGELIDEQLLPGLPTNLSLSENYLYIPYTANESGDEGVLLLKKGHLGAAPAVIPLNHCPTATSFRIYPCYAAITPDEATAYIVHEDSTNISVIDIASATVSGYIPVGRSISFLALLPNAQFAVAGSFMFADLSLIDLVNRRLLSMTDNSEREVFGQIAVIPGNGDDGLAALTHS